VIDTDRNTVIETITVGAGPRLPLVLPDGSAVYVPNEVDGTVSVIDPATRSVTATVDVGAGPRQPVALPDSSAVIVPNSDDGTVMVIGRH
jgi:YVTN family beta-propeller protein